jgi:hypothetical protein
VWQYQAWSGAGEEPAVSLNHRSTKISEVCGHVKVYGDPLPRQILSVLDGETHLGIVPTDWNGDPSYRSGGQHLLKLIDYYRRLEVLRRKG